MQVHTDHPIIQKYPISFVLIFICYFTTNKPKSPRKFDATADSLPVEMTFFNAKDSAVHKYS